MTVEERTRGEMTMERRRRKKEERDEGRRKEPSIIKYDWSLLSFGVMILIFSIEKRNTMFLFLIERVWNWLFNKKRKTSMIKCHWTAGLLCSILPDKTGKMSFLISQHFFSLPGWEKNAVPTKVELMRINRNKQKNTLNHSCCLCIFSTRPSSPLFFFILLFKYIFFYFSLSSHRFCSFLYDYFLRSLTLPLLCNGQL